MACPGVGSAANSDKVTSSRGALVPGPPARPSGGPELRGIRKASILLEILSVWVYRMASWWPISTLWAPRCLPGGSGGRPRRPGSQDWRPRGHFVKGTLRTLSESWLAPLPSGRQLLAPSVGRGDGELASVHPEPAHARHARSRQPSRPSPDTTRCRSHLRNLGRRPRIQCIYVYISPNSFPRPALRALPSVAPVAFW